MSKIATLASVLGLLLLGAGQAGAQTDYSKVEMKTTDLGRRTYMIEGAGGNITVAVGDNGDRSRVEGADPLSRQHALPWRSYGRE
jgi:cyclase